MYIVTYDIKNIHLNWGTRANLVRIFNDKALFFLTAFKHICQTFHS